MPRCPSCWSTVRELAGDCAQCGARLGARRTARPPLLVLAAGGGLLLAAGAGLGWWFGQPVRDDSGNVAGGPASDHAATVVESATRNPEAPEVAPRQQHHLVLGVGTRRLGSAVCLDSPLGPALLVLADGVPLDGSVRLTGRPDVALGVVHHDPIGNWLLLRPASTDPSIAPLIATRLPGPSTVACQVVAPDGTVGAAVVGARSGRNVIVTGVLRDDAVLDDQQRVFAIGNGPDLASPLDEVLPWLDRPSLQDLAAWQEQQRAADPDHLLERARELVERSSDDPDRLREAIGLLTRALAISTDAEQRTVLQRSLANLRLTLVRVLAARDIHAALAAADEALAFHPDHGPLLRDAIALACQAGRFDLARNRLEQLRFAEPSAANEARLEIAQALAAAATAHLAAGAPEEAAALARDWISVAPDQAGGHAMLARALARLGQTADALIAARTAAQLDAGNADLVATLERELDRDASPGAIEIPFDPSTHAIRTTVQVGNRAVEFVVDTGATTTTIPISVARELGLLSPTNQRVPVDTAGGTVTGEVVVLPNLRIGTTTLRRVQAIALDLPEGLANKGLLGMNALRRFDVQIDQQRGVLTLRPRR